MRDPNHLERPSACTLRAPTLRDTYKSLWETPITLRDQVHALWETHIHWQVCSWETNFILKGTLSFVGTPTVRDPPHALWVTPCMHFEEPIAFWWISNFDWHTAHCIVKMLLKGLWLLGWQNTKKCWADKPCCVSVSWADWCLTHQSQCVICSRWSHNFARKVEAMTFTPYWHQCNLERFHGKQHLTQSGCTKWALFSSNWYLLQRTWWFHQRSSSRPWSRFSA